MADGRRDLLALVPLLQCSEFEVQLIASRLIKSGLIELRDPRQTMLRMHALSTSADARPPSDTRVALMDNMALDMLIGAGRHPLARPQIQVLTLADHAAELPVEGRPDLGDRLLLSEAILARLALQRDATVHVRLIEDTL